MKCYNCVYLGEENGKFFCNFGDSEKYNTEVNSNDGCDDGEDAEMENEL